MSLQPVFFLMGLSKNHREQANFMDGCCPMSCPLTEGSRPPVAAKQGWDVLGWAAGRVAQPIFREALIFIVCLSVVGGCTGRAKRVRSGADSLAKAGIYCSQAAQTVVASWYGKDFHGRKTSSGEVYNMHALTAAHRTLPFGTVLEVTECKRGKSVRVTVNDRGPFIQGRSLDLSFGAAQSIGMVADGVAHVGLQILGSSADTASADAPDRIVFPSTGAIDAALPSDRRIQERAETFEAQRPVQSQNPADRFAVQVGAYQVKENALQMEERLRVDHPTVHLEVHETNLGFFYRVRVGPYLSEEEAQSVAREISPQVMEGDGTRPVVVRVD
jgi:rare lipoprotein A